MKNGLPYIEESVENNTDLYKMRTLVSEKMVADAAKPLIYRRVSVYKLPQKNPNQLIALNFWGRSDPMTDVRLNIKVKVINHVEVIHHLM